MQALDGRIAAIFRECAGVDLGAGVDWDRPVGQMGVNSIDLVKVVSRLEREFSVDFEELIFTEKMESARDFARVVAIAIGRGESNAPGKED